VTWIPHPRQLAQARFTLTSSNTDLNKTRTVGIPSVVERVVKAMSPGSSLDMGLMYYVKGALSGGICCGITHGAVCPLDVVKTRIQLQPEVYNKGLVGGMRQVVAAEGVGALATGLGPTVFGYFIQGWFKFGGVELFKIQFVRALGEQSAWDNRMNIYLASSAMAEFIADIFLCPLEATRIKLVANPSFASSMPSAMALIAKEEGALKGFYSGFGPILFKQVPYTMAKFAVQGIAAEKIYASMGTSPSRMSTSGNVGVSLGSGVIAGVCAAIISHPADTLLSKINKKGAGGDGGTVTRLLNIAKETGYMKLCTQGLGARCVMIGVLTAGQFGIFDSVMAALGASKYHFHDPKETAH